MEIELTQLRISIHAPAKGATIRLIPQMEIQGLFQSTHPRRVRHKLSQSLGWTLAISIHAPAKGATLSQNDTVLYDYISIHAPAKGATKHSRAFHY